MKKLVILFVLALTSCGGGIPMNVVMTNPTTGESIYVHHSPYSGGINHNPIIVGFESVNQQRMEIEAARMRGFTEIKEVR